jgi:Ca2+-binding EF-hand superfamily protein
MAQIFDTIRALGGQHERAKLELTRTGKRSAANINGDEIYKTALLLHEALSDADVKDMLEFADTDKSGTLNLQKFINIMMKTSIW